MNTHTHLDGSLGVGKRRLQSVGLVSVLSGLLLSFLKLAPQLGQRALQCCLLSLELLTELNLDMSRKSQRSL